MKPTKLILLGFYYALLFGSMFSGANMIFKNTAISSSACSFLMITDFLYRKQPLTSNPTDKKILLFCNSLSIIGVLAGALLQYVSASSFVIIDGQVFIGVVAVILIVPIAVVRFVIIVYALNDED